MATIYTLHILDEPRTKIYLLHAHTLNTFGCTLSKLQIFNSIPHTLRSSHFQYIRTSHNFNYVSHAHHTIKEHNSVIHSTLSKSYQLYTTESELHTTHTAYFKLYTIRYTHSTSHQTLCTVDHNQKISAKHYRDYVILRKLCTLQLKRYSA